MTDPAGGVRLMDWLVSADVASIENTILPI